MTTKGMRLLFAGLLLGAAMPALAQTKTSDEKKLDKAAMTMNKEAAKPEGEAAVKAKLSEEFGVDAARVQALRDQKLGYGEIGIVLSLAQGMNGGITDANVQQIMTMRKGPPVMGWGQISNKLGEKLGPVISKVKKVSSAARREAAEKVRLMKRERTEKREAARQEERHEVMERMQTHERPEPPAKR